MLLVKGIGLRTQLLSDADLFFDSIFVHQPLGFAAALKFNAFLDNDKSTNGDTDQKRCGEYGELDEFGLSEGFHRLF